MEHVNQTVEARNFIVGERKPRLVKRGQLVKSKEPKT
jgi:hypothetical protein